MNKQELLLPQLPSSPTEQHQLYEEAAATPTARRIYLAMTLMDQNDALLAKITQLRKLLQEEDLKGKIFREKITRNEQTVTRLRRRREELGESQRMATLNESSIPNKSLELGSTANTNSWAHELLTRDEADSLWSDKKQKGRAAERTEPKVKSYTIDITSFIPPRTATATARSSAREQTIDSYINQKQEIQEKLLRGREAAKKCPPRVSIKLDVGDKQRQLAKTLSQMRTARRGKNNPES